MSTDEVMSIAESDRMKFYLGLPMECDRAILNLLSENPQGLTMPAITNSVVNGVPPADGQWTHPQSFPTLSFDDIEQRVRKLKRLSITGEEQPNSKVILSEYVGKYIEVVKYRVAGEFPWEWLDANKPCMEKDQIMEIIDNGQEFGEVCLTAISMCLEGNGFTNPEIFRVFLAVAKNTTLVNAHVSEVAKIYERLPSPVLKLVKMKTTTDPELNNIMKIIVKHTGKSKQ